MPPRKTLRSLGLVWVLLTVLLLSSCDVDWSTWGFNNERQGDNPWESAISTSNVSTLTHQWSTNLGAYINAAPVEATKITVNGKPTDIIYVGTEHGDFYALNRFGRILWQRNLGSNFSDCPDTPDKIFGVSAPAVIDRAAGLLYVAGGDGKVYALDLATGAIAPGWPVTITTDPLHEFVYSAPALNGSNLYVGLSARCDITPYHGRLTRIDTRTRATNSFYVTGSPAGPSGGSIWGWGGASIDPRNGDVYFATGNTIANPEYAVYGEAVVRLTSALDLVSYHSPGNFRDDDDFGSTPTLFQKSGCPAQLATQQKNGNLYLYDRDAIASGPRQVIKTSGFSINVPAYSPSTGLLYVTNARANGYFVTGMLAFRLNADCKLELQWQTPAAVSLGSTPTVANGVVYYTGGFQDFVYALDARTGTKLWTSGSEIGGHAIATPTVVNGQLFIGSYDGRLHSYGLP